MKIFLSSLETSYTEQIIKYLNKFGIDKMKWNLNSFYYLMQRPPKVFDLILRNTEKIMIDSGAHSFQKGKTVNWRQYTREYAKWIKENDNDKIIGYFEMDVDNRIGYDKVLELRKILEGVTNKVIPVWHKNRGIEEYVKMCEEYSGRIVAISGFKNQDIKDHQYLMFLKKAWQHDCKLHCLGMTRTKILDEVPFDFTDSASWKLGTTFYRINGTKLNKDRVKENWAKAFALSYKKAMDMQEHYYKKWNRIKKTKRSWY